MTIKICVFDAYGTLFDINSAARRCAEETGRDSFSKLWPSISSIWREKQLSYTWLFNSLKRYSDFWEITENALDYALETVGLGSDLGLKKRLLDLYMEIETYGEVKVSLANLNEKEITCAILSNGSTSMLNSAIENSGISGLIHSVFSVDEVGIFKPDPKVYEMVLTHLPFELNEVLFISSNGWDIAGAASFGFKTVWINRSDLPEDKLLFKPDSVQKNLSELERYII